jgi:BirA family biotin operon repressor/biotin-[acetyl-CoA-carboxylase] ligase
MLLEGTLEHGTVIMADEQTKGRGQRGAVWQSEVGKNLQFSIFIKCIRLPIENQKIISQAVSIALVKTLDEFNIKAHVKWPNDIYIEDCKIAGVLIENSLKGTQIDNTIIGIGLNVNQSNFDLTNATSMYLETGRKTSVEEVLRSFLMAFSLVWSSIENGHLEGVSPIYYKNMLGYKQMRKYEDKNGVFIGIIESVNDQGKLVIYRNGDLMEYDLKELKFLW